VPVDPNTQAILGAQEEPGSVLFVLFIPSRTADDKPLPGGESQTFWADTASERLTEEFGGATAFPTGKGMWLNEETGKIVREDVILVHSYAGLSRAKDPERLGRLAELLHRMGKRTKQGEVVVVIDGIMYKIRKFTKAGRG
jgi:hypothetical protein